MSLTVTSRRLVRPADRLTELMDLHFHLLTDSAVIIRRVDEKGSQQQNQSETLNQTHL